MSGLNYCYEHDVHFFNDCSECMIDWLSMCPRCEEYKCLCEDETVSRLAPVTFFKPIDISEK